MSPPERSRGRATAASNSAAEVELERPLVVQYETEKPLPPFRPKPVLKIDLEVDPDLNPDLQFLAAQCHSRTLECQVHQSVSESRSAGTVISAND